MKENGWEMLFSGMEVFDTLSIVIGIRVNRCFQVSARFIVVIVFLVSVTSFGNYKLLHTRNTVMESTLTIISLSPTFSVVNLCFNSIKTDSPPSAQRLLWRFPFTDREDFNFSISLIRKWAFCNHVRMNGNDLIRPFD
jgi:hypothetical protein